MKAIVMAGGEGTRLRPLTASKPKPLVELYGRSVLWHTVERLRRLGIRDIAFTERYMPEKLREAFGDGEAQGVNIRHMVEREPLGTAGGVRACRDFIGGEDVLVLSGDAVWDLDLTGVLRAHRERRADATIVLYDAPDPTPFGLVLTDSAGRVTAFSEKPSWDRVVTDRINTGIYVLSPRAVEAIPEGAPYDFGRDLFPRLVREGYDVYGQEAPGYWCDVGSVPAYLACCLDILAGKADVDAGANEAEAFKKSGVTVLAPAFIAAGAVVAPGAVIGPNAVVGPGSKVEAGAVVTDSVLNGAHIGPEGEVRGAVLDRGVKLGRRARVLEGACLGEGAAVGDGAVIAAHVSLAPGKSVKPGAVIARDLMDRPSSRPPVFADDRRLRADAAALLDAALPLGARLGRAGRVAVAHTGGAAARLIADALCCGVIASGGEAARVDCDFEAELASLSEVFSFERSAFVRGSEGVSVTLLGPFGTPLDPPERGALEGSLRPLSGSDFTQIGLSDTISGSSRAYISAVCAAVRALDAPAGRPAHAADAPVGKPAHAADAPAGRPVRTADAPAGKPVRVGVTGRGAPNRALRCVLAALGHEVVRPAPGVPQLSVTPGGFTFTAKDEKGREIDEARAALLACEAAMRLGLKALAATPKEPEALRRLAVRYGCKVLETSTPEGRALYARQRLLRDGVLAAAVAVAAMARDGAALSVLLDALPDFAVAEKSVKVALPRAQAMRKLSEENADLTADAARGLLFTTPHGGVNIRPDVKANALVFRAEAETMEAAQELLARFTPQ